MHEKALPRQMKVFHPPNNTLPQTFNCSKCQRRYQKSDLTRHEKIHTEKGADKIFICETCGKAFQFRTGFEEPHGTV